MGELLSSKYNSAFSIREASKRAISSEVTRDPGVIGLRATQ
jgi:hypothetical protein